MVSRQWLLFIVNHQLGYCFFTEWSIHCKLEVSSFLSCVICDIAKGCFYLSSSVMLCPICEKSNISYQIRVHEKGEHIWNGFEDIEAK